MRGDSGSPQRTRLRSHVCEPRSIFSDAHVIGKNALTLRLRAQTLRGFLHIPINRFGGKSCFMHRTRYSQFVFRNNTVCSGKQRGFPVIYRQSDEARQTKPPIISFPLISPLSWAIVQPAAGPLSRRQIGWQKRNGVIRRSAFGVIGDGKRSTVPLAQRHGVQRRRQLKGQQDAVVGKLHMQRRKAAIDRAGAFRAARAGVVRYIRYLRIGIDRKRGDIKESDPPSVRQRFF